MKKILVIDDLELDFKSIKNTLEKNLGKVVEVFPKFHGENGNDYNYTNYLIGKLQEGDFASFLSFYNDIAIYIIDVYLIDDLHLTGIELASYISKNGKGDFKIIIISNNVINDQDALKNKVIFFSKYDKGKNYPMDLAKVVKNLLDETSPYANTVVNDVSSDKRKIGDIKDVTYSYKLHVFWEYIRDSSNRAIDKIIFLSFYIILLSTIFYAVWNIAATIYESCYPSHKTSNETSILKTSEHIFLYLLPVFITFGFFNYYINSARITLLGGKVQVNDEDKSTRTMNLTKVLFVSSIISYTLIKVLEKIFFDQELDVGRLIATGGLLLLLMGYFIFLSRKHH